MAREVPDESEFGSEFVARQMSADLQIVFTNILFPKMALVTKPGQFLFMHNSVSRAVHKFPLKQLSPSIKHWKDAREPFFVWKPGNRARMTSVSVFIFSAMFSAASKIFIHVGTGSAFLEFPSTHFPKLDLWG